MQHIAAALAKAQALFVQPEKNKTVTVRPKNSPPYSFEYADYNAIVEAVRGPLSSNGIAFTHVIEILGDRLMLVTKLIHGESGEMIVSVWPMSNSNDPKEVGGDMTYGKRYSLSAITGCVADDDTDAPGEKPEVFQDRNPKPAAKPAVKPVATFSPSFEESDLPIETRPATAPTIRLKGTPAPAQDAPAQAPLSVLSGPQFTRLWAIAFQHSWSNDSVHAWMRATFGKGSAKELTRAEYDILVDHIQNHPPYFEKD